MPNVRVITNDTEPAGKVLGEMLAGADEFLAASAFLNSGGLELVYSDMERILANEGNVQLIHGADFRIADPDAIDRLVELKERHLNRFYYYVVCDWHQTTSHHFHPKLYITTADYKRYSALIGSSNLTIGGMRHNVEVNVAIEGRKSEQLIESCLRAYQSMFEIPRLASPDFSFAELYREIYETAQELPVDAQPPDAFRELMRQLTPSMTPGVDDWEPAEQRDCIVKAFQELESEFVADANYGTASFELADIYERSIEVSVAYGIDNPFRKGQSEDSISSYIGHHEGPGKPEDTSELFERVGRAKYRLTEHGRKNRGEYVPRKPPKSKRNP